jgi:hypothetical protein
LQNANTKRKFTDRKMMSVERTRSSKIRFGESQEHEYHVYRTEEEKMASWYCSQQFEAMKCHAYGLAQTALYFGKDERLLRGNCLRGLEKHMGVATNKKRRRNIVRSIVELYWIEREGLDRDNADEIKATLNGYVVKHLEKARKAATARAEEDEAEALKIYFESVMPLTLGRQSQVKMVPTKARAA